MQVLTAGTLSVGRTQWVAKATKTAAVRVRAWRFWSFQDLCSWSPPNKLMTFTNSLFQILKELLEFYWGLHLMDCLLHDSLRCTWHELECLPLISAWRVIHCSREFRFPFFSKALCFPGCLSSSAFLPLWNLRLHFIMVLIILYCHPVCLPSYTRRFFVFCFFMALHITTYISYLMSGIY